MIRHQCAAIEISEVTNATDIDAAQRQRNQFDRNSAWLEANVDTVYSQHRGRFICVAGAELFVADTVQEAIAQATAAHPEDYGWFTRFIPLEKAARIYAV